MVISSAYTLRSLLRRPDLISAMSRKELLSSVRFAERYIDKLVRRYQGEALDFLLGELGLDEWHKAENLKSLTDSQLRSFLMWSADTLQAPATSDIRKARERDVYVRRRSAMSATADVRNVAADFEDVTDVDISASMDDMSRSRVYNLRRARYTDIAEFWGYTSGEAIEAAERLTGTGAWTNNEFNIAVAEQYYSDALVGEEPRASSLLTFRSIR